MYGRSNINNHRALWYVQVSGGLGIYSFLLFFLCPHFPYLSVHVVYDSTLVFFAPSLLLAQQYVCSWAFCFGVFCFHFFFNCVLATERYPAHSRIEQIRTPSGHRLELEHHSLADHGDLCAQVTCDIFRRGDMYAQFA